MPKSNSDKRNSSIFNPAVDSAIRTTNALNRELANAKAELGSVDTQLASEMAQIDRSLAVLQQERTENDARKLQILAAPEDGTLTTVFVTSGSAVQPGQALASFVPGSSDRAVDLEAHLFAPSRAAGFVQAGQSTWLRLAPYPYQKFGMSHGTISDVSASPISTQELPAGQGAALLQAVRSNEPLYRDKG